MREIAPGIFMETGYGGVNLGAIASEEEVMLVDCPLFPDDEHSWRAKRSKLGKAQFLAILDHHPDRILGARNYHIPRVAHDSVREETSYWSDTFKGATQPSGFEADRIKRITGIRGVIPELTFSRRMEITLGKRVVLCLHRPGPMVSSIWLLIPEEKVAFVGDVVMVQEPPYLGEADIEAWLDTLQHLRDLEADGYQFVPSRDLSFTRENINLMARFLRKVQGRLQRIYRRKAGVEACAELVPDLMQDFQTKSHRQQLAELRMKAGMMALYQRNYGIKE